MRLNMWKKKNITVKCYQFKPKKVKAKLKIDKKLMQNIIIIAIILFVIAIVLVYVSKCEKLEVIDVNTEIKQVAEKKSTHIVSYNIKTEEVDKTTEYLEKYIDINSDTIGHIKVDNTMIDYPVLQTDNNEYYMNHNITCDEVKNGSVFMDFRCDIDDFSKTRNIILYGHRMKDGSMFKDLTKYQDEKFFTENKIIKFDTLNGESEWEVFAVLDTTTQLYYIDTEFPYDNVWLAFLEEMQSHSIHNTNTNIYANDIVLTLSTCTTEQNGRLVVMAKL